MQVGQFILKKSILVEKTIMCLKIIFFHLGDDESDSGSFFCEKSYEPTTGTFYDLSAKVVMKPASESMFNFCASCERFEKLDERRTPKPIEQIETRDFKNVYRAVLYQELEYSVGVCVYLKPKTLHFESSTSHENSKSEK